MKIEKSYSEMSIEGSHHYLSDSNSLLVFYPLWDPYDNVHV